jgi:hypothetical protein
VFVLTYDPDVESVVRRPALRKQKNRLSLRCFRRSLMRVGRWAPFAVLERAPKAHSPAAEAPSGQPREKK